MSRDKNGKEKYRQNRQDENGLKGKFCIVTGGAQGIGKGICRHLLQLGMGVAIFDNDADAGFETLEELGDLGDLQFFHADVGSESDMREAVGKTLEHFGALHALINNAGIANPLIKKAEELELAYWEKIIRINLTGVFLAAKHCIPHLKTTGGSIVNVSSTRALQSEPDGEAYAASKGGVLALTHALAISLSGKVRVNCISPGWIDTSKNKKSSIPKGNEPTTEDHEQHPCGRAGEPADIAHLVEFLISPEKSGFITAQNFIVDGGMTKKMIYI